MSRKKIAIIGGGAAGFFCAANLDGQKFDITILEQAAEVLQKVKISGGGRCNVSHACYDPRELVQYYPRGERELRSVFSRFQPGDTQDWFEQRGVPLKTEADGRMFPQSNSSSSIVKALSAAAEENGAKVLTKSSVKQIRTSDFGFDLYTADDRHYTADYVIYSTGSSPKSWQIIEQLGHTLVPAVPSLFTFNIQNALLENMAGTAFPAAEVHIPAMRKGEAGPLLITHWGLSGPAVLRLSAWQARRLAEVGYHFDISVNFLGVSPAEAEEMLYSAMKEHPKKTVGQLKIGTLTQRFWQQVLRVNGLDAAKQTAHLSRKEIQMLASTLTHKILPVSGKSTFKEEFVTAGGVSLKEVDFKTMQSRKIPGLFLAGEVLDIDAVTGGFNFQACWSEGYIIAQHLNAQAD